MNRTFGVDALRRYVTLKTHRIHSLPIAILMPHSSCNCRCIMCDIWKNNSNLTQLSEEDIRQLLIEFERLGTRWVVLSGGEALMNPNLFHFCRLLKGQDLKISILSTGLLLKKYAPEVVEHVDEVIVSLDGSQAVHDEIRRIPRAFQKLADGVQAVKALKSDFRITGRCVIQRSNYMDWPNIIDAAHEIGLDQISFLAADVSTEAFNRPELWEGERVGDVQLTTADLPAMAQLLEQMQQDYATDFAAGFIAESPVKLKRIHRYYAALLGQESFPPVSCNAPWVSAVIEADGTVRPCYFHRASGNIRQTQLGELLNSPDDIAFRRQLNLGSDPICQKCVCTLNLQPTVKIT